MSIKCRLCMASSSNFTPVFNEHSELATRIFLITGVKVKLSQDKFVQNIKKQSFQIVELRSDKAYICNTCQDSLSSAIELRDISQQSNEYFKKSFHLVERDFFAKELDHLLNIKIEDDVIEIKHENVEIENDGVFCEPLSIEGYNKKNINSHIQLPESYRTRDLSSTEVHIKKFTSQRTLTKHKKSIQSESKKLKANQKFYCDVSLINFV